ncbi:hypothetical protein [Aporhodopirellula aestuarii]|uniref:Secreted protein n=1 Tax=Aporhodopirellula aestuarii TaxID=2950107 RepID=A0ABT0U2Y5_9BACT|nr:hypothetical protein [Aporhodopirellula aestuarii]MCM2371249.1 hypothetical protein [Aporhodopirellula aestuarii]
MKIKPRYSIACMALGLLLLPACTQNGGEAQKLTPPDDVDWAAIEAQGEAIADAQREGE